MAKKIDGYLKMQVPAGSASPSPPIGPALGQRGLNIMEFCKAFNAKTQEMEKDIPIPTGSAVEVMSGNKIVLEASDVLKTKSGTANSIDTALSVMEQT